MKVLDFFIVLLAFAFLSCNDDIPEEVIGINPEESNETWSDDSHSNNAEPNYEIVFPQSEVLRFDITISDDYWSDMQNDLAENLGTSQGGGPGGGRPGGQGGMVDNDTDFTPVWVPCTFSFGTKIWKNVGIRYKGNSSLSSVYNSTINKFSFKLDFDEFENDFPEINNQRLYGFKQLNLNNNFNDLSLMHEKVAPELFRNFGLAAPQTAFVALYIDFGSGAQYFGLYTLVEEVDDTVLDSQYNLADGNLYKPEGQGATFASGTFNTTDMYLKTNEDEADYSDVEALYTIINSEDRLNDIETWKTNLESILDVPVFIKWLAANTVIQNWDTYGRMNHNYYLYTNPESSKIEWIPWDNNEAFDVGKQGGAIAIDLADVATGWPLINNIVDVDEYRQMYDANLNEFVNNVFTESEMVELYEAYYNLIYDYVEQEESNYTFTTLSNFNSEVSFLKQHVVDRKNAVLNYLNK